MTPQYGTSNHLVLLCLDGAYDVGLAHPPSEFQLMPSPTWYNQVSLQQVPPNQSRSYQPRYLYSNFFSRMCKINKLVTSFYLLLPVPMRWQCVPIGAAPPARYLHFWWVMERLLDRSWHRSWHTKAYHLNDSKSVH